MSVRLTDANILVLAPHTDDGELGAGGSIARWVEEGNQVSYVAFSACETIQPEGLPADTLRTECSSATAQLGIPPHLLRILNFEVRHFERDRQAILDVMVDLNTELRPDLVLVPSLDDTHQDHEVVAREARRAFKRTRILGYEAPWNNFSFELTAFVPLKPRHVDAKWTALSQFRSQAGRPYMNIEYVSAQSRFRGVQAGTGLAEAFQVFRWFV